MKSYVIPIIVEPDEERWSAYVPSLEARGAVTWGHTQEEAIRNIQEVAQMVIEELIADGEPLPPNIETLDEPAVTVNI